jgi:beta-lactamase regulating signal transducer with metallopeptidase domain
MASDPFVVMFLKAQAAASGAILLVMVLRLPVRRILGAELGYHLWLLVPTVALASLFPTLPQFRDRAAPSGLDWTFQALRTPTVRHADQLGLVWAVGAVLMAVAFAYGQWRFDRSARAGEAGPAATGFWPRMVTPADYADRFTEEERALIRSHERGHMARRDPTANLLIAFLQAVSWFNPLAHLAARLARMDQELSIDAQVMALHPKGRRRYAETLLKAYTHGLNSPLACALAQGGRHPLEVRLAMLGVRRISVRRDLFGVFALGAVGVALIVALWTLAPL